MESETERTLFVFFSDLGCLGLLTDVNVIAAVPTFSGISKSGAALVLLSDFLVALPLSGISEMVSISRDLENEYRSNHTVRTSGGAALEVKFGDSFVVRLRSCRFNVISHAVAKFKVSR